MHTNKELLTTAQCHTEDGQVYMTDQSGNGNHATHVTNYDAIRDLKSENAELRRDKARLDWLLSENMLGDHSICIVDLEGQWVDTRELIDKAIHEAEEEWIRRDRMQELARED